MKVTEEEQPHQENFVSYFPKSIIQDFLSRLPVKSLLRFRSVCRSWKGIMSDPQFVKDNLERALQKDRSQSLFFISRNRIFIESERNRGINDDDVDDGIIVAEKLDLPFSQALAAASLGAQIFGSCNGLVCLAINNKIHLFNPSTRESKKIPDPHDESYRTPSAARFTSIRQTEACGFGYDSRIDDYKVVVMSHPRVVSLYSVSVYSLRQKYWQTIMEFPYKYVFKDSERATFLNRALHWLVRGLRDRRYHGLVAAFDLTTEQLRDIPLPDILSSCLCLVLGVIRERLCLFHSSLTREYEDFWQMNVYGDSTSWTRFRTSLSYMRLQPLRSGKDAEDVLVKVGRRLIMYDRGTNTYSEVRVHGFSTRFQFQAMTYLDTLVSPNKY